MEEEGSRLTLRKNRDNLKKTITVTVNSALHIYEK